MTAYGRDFRSLRSWRGSQDQAFEELCYQLHDPTPHGAELVKTGNPDAGLEWYVERRNGVQWGWQAKFTFDVETLLKLMEKSLRTVIQRRPRCRRLYVANLTMWRSLPNSSEGWEASVKIAT